MALAHLRVHFKYADAEIRIFRRRVAPWLLVFSFYFLVLFCL